MVSMETHSMVLENGARPTNLILSRDLFILKH